jgi:acetyltransferase-like isoleucine patch superfamily enzyme
MDQISLAYLTPRGYIDATATIYHSDLRLGQNVYVGPGTLIYQNTEGGPISLGDRAEIHRQVVLESGLGGYIEVGAGTGIHSGCQLKAYVAPILVGEGVMIAANVALYSYDHGVAPDAPIYAQPLVVKGPITIKDEAWIGTGAILLSGVTIGEGAVVGAGAVVTRDVPAGGIAVGNPARIIRYRNELPNSDNSSEQR